MQVSGCILAGGAARRFNNRPKGLLQISSGLTIIDQLMHILGKAGVTDVAISVAQSGTYERSPVPVIHDRFSDAGPLAGIEAGLFRSKLVQIRRKPDNVCPVEEK